jgi:hypothetical protein
MPKRVTRLHPDLQDGDVAPDARVGVDHVQQQVAFGRAQLLAAGGDLRTRRRDVGRHPPARVERLGDDDLA